MVLAAGDYLLWNWSLAGSHDTMALLSGLTLPLLAIALVRMLLWSLASLIARSARLPRTHDSDRQGGSQLDARKAATENTSPPLDASSSGKLAA
jgi:hypothetical protein